VALSRFGEALPVVVVDQVGVVVQQPVQRGGGGVVGLADDGAGAGLGGELLLGQEQVDLQRGQRPQLVEQIELAAAVVAEVADVATHDRPVLLLDVGLVVLVAGPTTGEGDPAAAAPAGEVVVDELAAVDALLFVKGCRRFLRF